MSTSRLLLLGAPALTVDGKAVRISAGKSLGILVYLALSPAPPARDDLAHLFWPGCSRSLARQSVRQALSFLRKLLGGEVFTTEDPVVLRDGLVATDVEELEAALAEDRIGDAIALWRGPFLQRFALVDVPQWNEWVEGTRCVLDGRYASALYIHAMRARASGNLEAAAEYLRLATEVQPFGAAAWIDRFEVALSLRDLDQAARIIAEAEFCAGDLDGVDVAAWKQRLHELRERQMTAPLGGRLSLDFVGRAREFADLVERWRLAQRGGMMVAILRGPAGIGKGRLASEVGRLAKSEGSTVVKATATQLEQNLRWGLAVELIRGLLASHGANGISCASDHLLRSLAPDLVRAQDRAARRGEIEPVTLAGALGDLINAVAYEAPLFIQLDDVHWADGDSVALIGRVIRRLKDLPCLVLLTCRETEAGAAANRLITLLERECGAHVIFLGRLARAEVAELLMRTIVWEENAALAQLEEFVWSATQGNPLHVEEILHGLSEVGVLADGNGPPCGDGASPPKLALAPGSQRELFADFLRWRNGGLPPVDIRPGGLARVATELLDPDVSGRTGAEGFATLYDQRHDAQVRSR